MASYDFITFQQCSFFTVIGLATLYPTKKSVAFSGPNEKLLLHNAVDSLK